MLGERKDVEENDKSQDLFECTHHTYIISQVKKVVGELNIQSTVFSGAFKNRQTYGLFQIEVKRKVSSVIFSLLDLVFE